MDIQSSVVATLSSVALATLSLLGGYAVTLAHKAKDRLKAETQKLSDEQGRQIIDNALDDLDNLTSVTIQSIEQTAAKELRQAVKDGKAGKTELIALGKQAFYEIKTAVTPEVQDVIAKNFGSFDDYLTNLIESKVLALKSVTNG